MSADDDLGAPAVDDRPWWRRAECRGYDGDLFFPPGKDTARGSRTPIIVAQIRAAKAVCAICPVSTECLQHALDEDEVYGIWGGHTPEERRTMRRARLRTINHRSELVLA